MDKQKILLQKYKQINDKIDRLFKQKHDILRALDLYQQLKHHNKYVLSIINDFTNNNSNHNHNSHKSTKHFNKHKYNHEYNQRHHYNRSAYNHTYYLKHKQRILTRIRQRRHNNKVKNSQDNHKQEHKSPKVIKDNHQPNQPIHKDNHHVNHQPVKPKQQQPVKQSVQDDSYHPHIFKPKDVNNIAEVKVLSDKKDWVNNPY